MEDKNHFTFLDQISLNLYFTYTLITNIVYKIKILEKSESNIQSFIILFIIDENMTKHKKYIIITTEQ